MWAKVLAPNPWVILAAVVALGAALTGSFFYGISVGEAKNQTKWQKREIDINAESTKKLAAANARVLAAERKSAGDMASVSKAYQDKLQEKDHEKDRAIARARASGLFVATKRPTCGNAVPAVGPSPGGRDDAPRSELSDGASEFFIAEANRADKIVEQLQACQAIVRADRQQFP